MLDVITQHIATTPEIFNGKPHIVGHRIRVLDIVVWHEKRGLGPDEILDLYPTLTLSDVYAALAYYFDHRAEIEADFQREAANIARLQTHYPSKLKARLKR